MAKNAKKKISTASERSSDIKDLLLGALKAENKITGPITVEQLSGAIFLLLVDLKFKMSDKDPKEWLFLKEHIKPLFTDEIVS